MEKTSWEARASGRLDGDAIKAWLTQRFASELDVSPSEIDADEDVGHFGLTSISAATISKEMEDMLGVEISPTIFWDRPTICRMAEYFSQSNQTGK